MAQFGEVEKIVTRPCKNGIKIVARVLFRQEESVKKIQAEKKKWVFVGRDLARLSTIGKEKVVWELRYVAKLSQLPMGTTPLDLKEILGENKAEFLIIPRIFSKEGKYTKTLREAFVYFSSEADMVSCMEIPIK
ncbi:hypothetical protein BX616_009162, partial [Lobosporangium transversale]